MKQETITREFDQYCDEIVKKYQIPGFSIGLAKDGELFYENGFGYRNVEKKLPLSSDTVFGIGSVTKSLTCVAILQLQEAGKLSVHDLVIKYLPEFKTPNDEYTQKITIHHFMTHSAGLPPLSTLYSALRKCIENDPKFEDEKNEKGEELAISDKEIPKPATVETYEDLIEIISNEEYTLLGAPGTQFSYSNDCYSLLGLIIERVSGISYEQYIKDYILKPACMNNTVFHLEELDEHQDISCLYNSRKKDGETIIFESNNPWDAPPMRAAGFLKSTVNDMLKYSEIFRNNGRIGEAQILSPESVELITTPYINCDNGRFYGYGVMITPNFFGYKLVEHGGSIKGVAAQMNIIPELGLTGVSLANLASVPSTKLLFSAFGDYLGKPVNVSHFDVKVIDLSIDELKEYEGEFVSGEGQNYRFHVEKDELQFSTAGIDPISVKPIGGDMFLFNFREDDCIFRFVRDEDSKIIRIAFGYRQIPKVG